MNPLLKLCRCLKRNSNGGGEYMKQNNALVYGLVGAVIGGILVWCITLSGVNTNRYGWKGMMGFNSQTTTNQNWTNTAIDRHFIEQMIPHHQDAITMAKVAQTKAQHSEIKSLAKNIIDSQRKEIQQMNDWYKAWFGKEVPSDTEVMNQHGMMRGSNSTHMGMMGDDTDTAILENSSNFDKTFIEEMIPHHQMAVMMANMLLQGTSRPEMKQLAQNIISSQTKEINEMRQWYKDWGFE